MQVKFIEENEYKTVRPSEWLSFSLNSPVASISKPPNARCFAMHGSYSVFGAQGTVYAIRNGFDDELLHIDAYSYKSKDVGDRIEISGPLRGASQIEQHHSLGLPGFMDAQASDLFKNLVSK